MPSRCKFKGGCKKRAIYNTPGESKLLYCKYHKEAGMVDVVHKRCEFKGGCDKRPYFNTPGEKSGLYCVDHKTDDMIDVKNKKCMTQGCDKQPYFNTPGEKSGLYCKDHKEAGMVNVIHKRCKSEGCNKRPSYNTPEETSGLYCKDHKEAGMVDVVHKRCMTQGCDKLPSYNTPGETKGLYCYSHKEKGMIDVVSKRCKSKGCDKRPYYNTPGKSKGLYCLEHKTDDMIDVVSKRCKNDWCYTLISNPKYEGYCAFCFSHMFPDNEKSKNYKTKEIAVRDYISERYPDFTWICDTRIPDGCSRRRPDLMLDLGYQVIIIEVDENQHIFYDSICENKRLMELSQDINHRNLVFIRFNPDAYKTRENKTIKSCWEINKSSGILIISSQNNWDSRLNAVKETIQYWIDNKTNKTIEVVELFYDEFE